MAELTRRRFRSHPAIHWRQIVIALEIAILGLVALLPTGEWDTAANVLVSFVCAVQVQSFRKIRGNPCATTMCTGNLRSGTELLFHAVQDHDPTARRRGLQYYAIILLFILGAFLGVWSSAPCSSNPGRKPWRFEQNGRKGALLRWRAPLFHFLCSSPVEGSAGFSVGSSARR